MTRRWTEADLHALIGRGGKAVGAPEKTPRYTAKREFFDGIEFGSQAELARYKDLKLMQSAGAIRDLHVHPRYELHVLGVCLGYAELDFEYFDTTEGRKVYEDVKSPKKNTLTRTPIYKWKARHLDAEYGIQIREVA